MSDSPGIALRGRMMLHEAWTDDKVKIKAGKATAGLFPRPAGVIIEITTAFIKAGGDIDELVKLLNSHIPDFYAKIDYRILFNQQVYYSIEFQFYIVQFTKILLDDINFRYIIDDKTQLGEYHYIIEKGPMNFPPWVIDDGGQSDGYLSILNLKSMFNYVEEKYIPPLCAKNDIAEIAIKLSQDAITYLNECTTEKYRVDRTFFDKEGILISFEYLFYGAAIFSSLTNDELFVNHAHYYGYLHCSQLVKAIFLQPDISPVEGFREWQQRTNNIYKMEFRSRYRSLYVKLHLRKQVQTGMFDLYRQNSINGIKQAAPSVYKAFLELATQKQVKTGIIQDKKNEYIFSVKVRWRTPHSSPLSYLTAGICSLVLFAAALCSRFFLSPQHSTLIIASAFAVISAGLISLSLNWRNRLRAVKNRFNESRKVISRQLDSLKATTNELLAERDALDKKVAERTADLNDALEQLKQLDRSKTNFIANVSHELRTPLTLLSVPLDGIKKGRYGNKLDSDHPVFSLIERNVGRLNNQINQLLDFSRLDLGTMTFEPHHIEIIGYCRLLTAELESLAEKKGIYLRMNNQTGADELLISTDERLFEIMLLNLLNNALKFTDSGGVSVVLFRQADSDFLELRVEDTGIGFPVEQKSRLFQRFAQAEDCKERRREGAGLGLSLVDEIVKRHGWDIDVESSLGRGSAFIIKMPLVFGLTSDEAAGFLLPEDRTVRHEIAGAGLFFHSIAQPENYSSNKDTIMIIEDNPDMGAVLQDLLADDYNLKWCIGGSEALEWLETSPQLSLIICDVMMPGMSGFSFRGELLRTSSYCNLPFIYLTALADPLEKVEGLKTGAVDYIQKPFSADVLLLKIRNLIDTHKASYLQAVRDKTGAERLNRMTDYSSVKLHQSDWHSFGITDAEKRIIELLRRGMQDKEIAAELNISPRTVSSHLSHIYQKTDTQNRVELLNILYK